MDSGSLDLSLSATPQENIRCNNKLPCCVCRKTCVWGGKNDYVCRPDRNDVHLERQHKQAE